MTEKEEPGTPSSKRDRDEVTDEDENEESKRGEALDESDVDSSTRAAERATEDDSLRC